MSNRFRNILPNKHFQQGIKKSLCKCGIAFFMGIRYTNNRYPAGAGKLGG